MALYEQPISPDYDYNKLVEELEELIPIVELEDDSFLADLDYLDNVDHLDHLDDHDKCHIVEQHFGNTMFTPQELNMNQSAEEWIGQQPHESIDDSDIRKIMDNNTWGNINDYKNYNGEEYYEDI